MSEWKGTKTDWTLGEEMNRIEGNIQNNHDRIDQNEGDIQNNSSKIDQAEETIQSNSDRLDQAESNIQNNSDRINEIKLNDLKLACGSGTVSNGETDTINIGFTADVVMVSGVAAYGGDVDGTYFKSYTNVSLFKLKSPPARGTTGGYAQINYSWIAIKKN